jgi:hypothetical protein
MSKLIYKAQERPYGSDDINDLIEKGGEGSGKKGHMTSKQYSWGKMRHVAVGKDYGIPIHPEHHDEIQAVNQGHKEKGQFKDETGADWSVHKHPEGDGVHLKGSPKQNGNRKVHITAAQLREHADDTKKD